MGVGGQHYAPAALPPGKRPGTHFIGGWVGPRVGVDGCGKLARTGIRSPDRPVRSESLYRLSYPGPLKRHKTSKITFDLKKYIIWDCGNVRVLRFGWVPTSLIKALCNFI